MERLPYLRELCDKNGDKLCHFTRKLQPKEKFENVENVFNYSNRHGGTLDGFKYYDDYYILKGGKKKVKNDKIIPIEGFRYYKFITKEEYENLAKHDYTSMLMVGNTKQAYAMYLDERQGTVLAPVLVLKNEAIKEKVVGYFKHIRDRLYEPNNINDITIFKSFIYENGLDTKNVLGVEMEQEIKDYLGNVYEIKFKDKAVVLVEEFANGTIWRENCYKINYKDNSVLHSDIEDYFSYRDYYLHDKDYQFEDIIKLSIYEEEKQVDKHMDTLLEGKKEITSDWEEDDEQVQ